MDQKLHVRRTLLRLLQKFLSQVDYGDFAMFFAMTHTRVPAADDTLKSARVLVMVLGSGRDICDGSCYGICKGSCGGWM